MSDLSKISTENQREMLKLIAPTVKKQSNLQDLGDLNSETENIFAAPTSTHIKTKTTASNNAPLVSRNNPKYCAFYQ